MIHAIRQPRIRNGTGLGVVRIIAVATAAPPTYQPNIFQFELMLPPLMPSQRLKESEQESRDT